MIDHVSVPVGSLVDSTRFYQRVLATLGYALLVDREGSVGFGKRHPEFWINARPGKAPSAPGSGAHVALRAGDCASVDAFHAAALENGGAEEGAPGRRRYSQAEVYAAFIRDPDGNKVEAMTILPS